ncbi:hypothetical protein ACJX0J_033021, partial [Zea mays]
EGEAKGEKKIKEQGVFFPLQPKVVNRKINLFCAIIRATKQIRVIEEKEKYATITIIKTSPSKFHCQTEDPNREL